MAFTIIKVISFQPELLFYWGCSPFLEFIDILIFKRFAPVRWSL